MLQSEKKMKARHREKNYFKRPRSTQDLIPVDTVYPDGMFLSNGSVYSRTYRFSDINYQIAGQSEKPVSKTAFPPQRSVHMTRGFSQAVSKFLPGSPSLGGHEGLFPS